MSRNLTRFSLRLFRLQHLNINFVALLNQFKGHWLQMGRGSITSEQLRVLKTVKYFFFINAFKHLVEIWHIKKYSSRLPQKMYPFHVEADSWYTIYNFKDKNSYSQPVGSPDLRQLDFISRDILKIKYGRQIHSR